MIVKIILAVILLCIVFKGARLLTGVAVRILGFLGFLIIASAIFRLIF